MYKPVRSLLTILCCFSSVALTMASCASGDSLMNPTPIQQSGAGTSAIAENTSTNTESCGNGVKETDPITQITEECDLTDLGGSSCELLGYVGGGALSCLTDCTYDTDACLMEVAGPDASIFELTYGSN